MFNFLLMVEKNEDIIDNDAVVYTVYKVRFGCSKFSANYSFFSFSHSMYI